MLLELAKAEGLAQMTNVFLEGKEIEKVDKEFIDKLPMTGIFEGTYICQKGAEKDDVREKIGRVYLDWVMPEEEG